MVNIDDDIVFDPTKLIDLESPIRDAFINEINKINEHVHREQLLNYPSVMRALKFAIRFMLLSFRSISYDEGGFKIDNVLRSEQIINYFKIHAPIFMMFDSERVKFPKDAWTLMDMTSSEIYLLLQGSQKEIEEMVDSLYSIKEAIMTQYHAVGKIYYKVTGKKQRRI